MPSERQVRMLIYSQDGFGLGHLRRNLNIAVQVKRHAPRAAILMVADSPAAPFFRLPPRCDFVKIPTLVKVNTGTWRSDRLPLAPPDLVAVRSELIQDVAVSYRPNLFLVDHLPNGVSGELARALEVLRRRCPQTRVMLGLRDILGSPSDICRQWCEDGHYDAAERFYDGVLIYGSRELFDLVTEYHFPDSLGAKAHYCGYVSREHIDPRGTHRESRASSRRPAVPSILVTGGGGADSSFFIDRFMDAARLLARRMRFRATVPVGPFLHPEQHALLRRKAKGLPIQVRRRGEDSIRLLRQSDLVICMAGYNTISEIMRFGKKAIVIPRPGPSAEQTMRTRIMSRIGLFATIHPHDLTAEALADRIVEKLAEPLGLEAAGAPRLDGASYAAAEMLFGIEGAA